MPSNERFDCPECGAAIRIPAQVREVRPTSKIRCPGCRTVRTVSGLRGPSPRQAEPGTAPPRAAPHAAPPEQPTPPVSSWPSVDAPDTPTEHWVIDRARYQGKLFTADQLTDMARQGQLLARDKVRGPEFAKWTSAERVALLQTPIKMYRKDVESRLRSLARKKIHICEHHPGKSAKHVCTDCAHAYCGDCVNDDGSCRDCDGKLARL